jgi:hypothetical protein
MAATLLTAFAVGCASGAKAPALHDQGSGAKAPVLQNATPRAVADNGTPAPVESNPPGDIPDTQAFVTYISPSGYLIDAPEGWARSTQTGAVMFSDKYDGEQIDISRSPGSARSISQPRAFDRIRAHARVVRDLHASTQTLAGSKVMRVDFTSNSAPNPVTGRSIRLDDSAYFFANGGKQAMLLLWAPAGSDNVDQWKRIVTSFRWR